MTEPSGQRQTKLRGKMRQAADCGGAGAITPRARTHSRASTSCMSFDARLERRNSAGAAAAGPYWHGRVRAGVDGLSS